MSDESSYRGAWDGYWRDVATTVGEVFWDTEPEAAALRDLDLFADAFAADRPLVDLGCGSGRQSRALAERFARVIGVDISAEAIRGAEALYARDGLSFRVLDVLAEGGAAALHAEIGDANVYVRGVIHQLRAEDRGAAVASLAALLGARGRAVVVELAPEFEAMLRSRTGPPPPKLARVLAHGIVPATLAPGELEGHFAARGLGILGSGKSAILTTQALPDGQRMAIPCDAWLIGRAGAAS
ncbi:MAG: class I SAM-dependent methyltransferase [Nannocystaceae bacterium]